MSCEELMRLEKEQGRITGSQKTLRENRRYFESGEHYDMKKQLQKDALDLVAKITEHKETCPECQQNG